MSLSPIPTERHIDKPVAVEINPVWQAWFESIQFWLFPVGQFGTTANRPTVNLYVGRGYYDTTLQYPVWVHQVSPSIIWHNASGAPV